MKNLKLKIILKVMKWFVLHNIGECSIKKIEKINNVHEHTIKQGKDFSNVVRFIIFICEYLGVDINGINRVNDGLPYDKTVCIWTDSDSTYTWKDDFHVFSDLIYLKHLNIRGKCVKYIPTYKKAIAFKYHTSNEISDWIEEVDGIKLEQEILAYADVDNEYSVFTPKTFIIDVKMDDYGVYHIKNRHQLTAARKVYNIPNIKRAKEIKEINSF